MSDAKDIKLFVAFEKGAATPTGEFIRGWLSVVIDKNGNQVADDEGDRVSMPEITKAAHTFITKSRAGKVHHKGGVVGQFVESVLIDDDFAKAFGITSKQRGWWGNFQVLDPIIKARAARGEFKGFSIGGQGFRITKKV